MKWELGRQGTGYFKKKLLQSKWPLPFDLWLLKYPEGTYIPPHRDPVEKGRHFRLNVVVWKAKVGGDCKIYLPIPKMAGRINFFRPDLLTHEVTKVEKGTRYVVSLGYIA